VNAVSPVHKLFHFWGFIESWQPFEQIRKLSIFQINLPSLISYLVTRGSPRQFRLCVVVSILFICLWTYLSAISTRGPIFRKEAETRIEMTLSGSKVGASTIVPSPSASKYLWKKTLNLSQRESLLISDGHGSGHFCCCLCRVGSAAYRSWKFPPNFSIFSLRIKKMSSSRSHLSHSISHSKIVTSQCTDMSTSSRLCPVVMSLK